MWRTVYARLRWWVHFIESTCKGVILSHCFGLRWPRLPAPIAAFHSSPRKRLCQSQFFQPARLCLSLNLWNYVSPNCCVWFLRPATCDHRVSNLSCFDFVGSSIGNYVSVSCACLLQYIQKHVRTVSYGGCHGERNRSFKTLGLALVIPTVGIHKSTIP